MKTRILTAAMATLTMFGAAPRTEAHSRHGSMYSNSIQASGRYSYGTPVYTERYLAGYDCRGNPIWRYRVVEAPRYYHPCPPPRCYRPPVCPPPRPACGSYRNSGIVIQAGFRL